MFSVPWTDAAAFAAFVDFCLCIEALYNFFDVEASCDKRRSWRCDCRVGCSEAGVCCNKRYQSMATFQQSCARIEHLNYRVVLTNRCPPTTATRYPEMARRCATATRQEHFLFEMPVFWPARGRLFRNRFCAGCHGARNQELSSPDVLVNCVHPESPPKDFSYSAPTQASNQELLARLLSGQCHPDYVLPFDWNLRQCFHYHAACPSTQIEAEACATAPTARLRCFVNNQVHIFRNDACRKTCGFRNCSSSPPDREDYLFDAYHFHQSGLRLLFDFLSLEVSPGKVNRTDFMNVTQKSFQGDHINYTYVMNLVCLSVSVVALLILLLVYTLLPRLRNNAGRLVMSLATTLLLAYALLMTTLHVERGTAACLGLGGFSINQITYQ